MCQEILRTLLHDPELIVLSVISQHTEKSLYREITLDAKCIMGDGSICNIEVQKGNINDDIRRVRFHVAVLTANNTPKGIEFKDVPDVKVLYITEYDALKVGKAVVHVTRCADDGNGYRPLDDGEDIIFANTEAPGTEQETHLLKLFLRKDAFNDEMYPALSEAVIYFKEKEGGVREMCKAVQEYAEMYAEDKKNEWRQEEMIALVKEGLLKISDAAKRVSMSEEEFKKLI